MGVMLECHFYSVGTFIMPGTVHFSSQTSIQPAQTTQTGAKHPRALASQTPHFQQSRLSKSLDSIRSFLSSGPARHQTAQRPMRHPSTSAPHLSDAFRLPQPPKTDLGHLPAKEIKRFAQAGFDECLMKEHKDFVFFLIQTQLYKRLRLENNPIAWSSEGEPCLRLEGQFTPWSELNRKFSFSKKDGIRDISSGQQFTYMAQGLTPWNPKTWGLEKKPLIPTRQLAEAPEQPLLEVVMLTDDNHAWLRLITDQGEVYSWGAALKDKTLSSYGPKAATVDGVIASPDTFEFSSQQRIVRSIQIDRQTANKVLQSVAQSAETTFGFSWLGHELDRQAPHNCNTLASEFVYSATQNKPETQSTLTERFLRRAGLEWKSVPKPIRFPLGQIYESALSVTITPILSAVILSQGGTQAQSPEHETAIQHPIDFFRRKHPTDPELLRNWIKNCPLKDFKSRVYIENQPG